MRRRQSIRKTPVTILAVSVALALTAPAFAQQAAPTDAERLTELDKVTVTGYRASLQKSLDENDHPTRGRSG